MKKRYFRKNFNLPVDITLKTTWKEQITALALMKVARYLQMK